MPPSILVDVSCTVQSFHVTVIQCQLHLFLRDFAGLYAFKFSFYRIKKELGNYYSPVNLTLYNCVAMSGSEALYALYSFD